MNSAGINTNFQMTKNKRMAESSVDYQLNEKRIMKNE